MDFKKKTNKTRCRACPASGFCSDVCYNRDVPDANCAHAVKYDKLNKRIAILEAQSTTQAANVLQVQQAQKDVSKEIRDEIRGLRAELMSLFRKDRQ